MASSLGSLIYTIGADSAQFTSEMGRLNRVAQEQSERTRRTLMGVTSASLEMQRGINAAASQVVRQNEAVISSFGRVKAAAIGALGLTALTSFSRGLGATADGYNNITAKLTLVTAGSRDLAAAQEKVFSISQKTYSSLDSTATLATRTQRALVSNGASADEALRKSFALTQTIQQAFAVSGATADEAKNATIQLSQGLASGVLRGEEFNSITEQGSRIAEALAKSLGVTTGQLREMAQQGKLTTDVVVNGLSSQARVIDAEFSKLPVTISRATTLLDNAWTKYVGEADQAVGASRAVAESIAAIGRNLGPIIDGAATLGVVIATTFAGRAVQAVGAYAQELVKAAAAQSASLEMERLAAAASLESARAKSVDLTQTLEVVAAARQQTLAMKAVAEADILAAQRHLDAAKAAGVQSFALREQAIATERLIAAKQRQRGIVNELASLGEAEAKLQAGLASAAAAQTSAQIRLSGALSTTQFALQQMSRIGSSLFAMIGGWPTVVLAAAAATYEWLKSSKEVSAGLSQMESEASRLKESNEALRLSLETAATGAALQAIKNGELTSSTVEQILKQRDLIQANQDYLLSTQAVTGSVGTSVLIAGAYQVKMALLTGDLDKATEAQKRFNAELDQQRKLREREAAIIAGPPVELKSVLNAKDIQDLDASLRKSIDSVRQQRAEMEGGTLAGLKYKAMTTLNVQEWSKVPEATRLIVEQLANEKGALDAANESKRKSVVADRESEKSQKALAKAALEQQEAQEQFQDQLLGLAADLGGPLAQAQEKYRSQLTAAAKAMLEGKVAREDYLRYQQLLERQLVDSTREIERQLGVVESYVAQMRGETATLGMTERQKALADALKKSADEWGNLDAERRKAFLDAGSFDPTSDAGIKAITEATNAFYDQKEAIEASQRAAEQWASLWQDSARSVSDAIAGFATGSIRKFSDFGKALIDIAKQTVARIISSFLEMRVIGPLFQSILGGIGGGGGYGGLVQAGMGLVTGGQGVTSTGLLNFASTASGGTANSLFNDGSWISAGKNLWSGFSNGWQSFWGNGNAFTMGPPTAAGSTTSFQPGYQSGFGQALGVAGGIYAGYNRFQNRYDTGSGLAGAAAYGYGTYAAGAGIATAAATGSIAAGLAAIPVVGWVAIAAMLIDKLSGGSLFGTDANKFQRGESNLTVGPDGGIISIGADYKGRKPLFGGSYHEWKNITPTQDQIDAANGFYRAILDQSTSFAKQFGQNVGEVATGTFRQIFDKNGNVTGSLSIVNGVEYQGEDQQAFAQRILAESMILDLKKIGVDISDYTQQFIKDAEAYSQAVQDSGLALQYANQDLKNGIDISGGKGLQGAFDTTLQYQDGSESLTETYQRLSQEAQDLRDGIKLLTGQDTIESIEAFIRESQKVGESLTQTYVRLQQATAAYNSFVGQFAPQAEYVDDFEAALSGVYAQMQANIDQANALAKAAGLEGASVKDLTNIHAYAAKQFATLLAQLKDSARSLAYQMGLIGPYNLDQVNSEIADLEGKANAGANAVQDFGRTITDVANRANNAMQLLLGDLSPLNDQEKLQKALEGLRAGSVSQEEVLQIGRRLYASSEAYNQLFRQVQQFAPNPSTFGGGSYSSGANAGARGGLTEKDRQRLQELYKQQAGLLAAQDYANAQTLARQIAEISAASGDDLDAILKEWGLSADDLAKRLHLENATQLDEYIEGQKKLVDSNGQNTTILADLLRQIRDLLSHGGTDFRSPGGRGGRVGTMTAEDADMIGAAVERHRDDRAPPMIVGNRRNVRPYSP